MYGCKRVAMFLLAVAVLLMSLPAGALAEDGAVDRGPEAEDFFLDREAETSPEDRAAAMLQERISGETAEGNIRYEYGADGVLRLHGTGPMADYGVDNRPPWLENTYVWKRIKAVVVDEGITSIGAYAFALCSGLKTVQLPEGITGIGESAFQGCRNLVQIDLPEGVREISRAAFFNCPNLLLAGLPSSLERIGDIAFGRCEELLRVFYCGTLEQLQAMEFGLGVMDVLTKTIRQGRLPRYTVSFDSQGGSPVPSASVLEFASAIRPVDPVRAGMRFEGWYREPECIHAYRFFEETTKGDLTLYAKWTGGGSIPIAPESGKFLPVELDALSIRTLLGEENYTACLEQYGADAVVQAGVPRLGYTIVPGGLESGGIPDLSGLFYIESNRLWEEKQPFTIEIIVGKTAAAMDTDSSRYTLSFDVYFMDEILELSLTAEQADGTRVALEDFDVFQQWEFQEVSLGILVYNALSGYAYSPEFVRENKILAGLGFRDSFDAAGCELSVYSGWSDKVENYLAHPEREITGRIWNQGDLTAGGGWLLENTDLPLSGSWAADSGMFSVLIKRNGVTEIVPMMISIFPPRKSVGGRLYAHMGQLRLGEFKVKDRTEGLQTNLHQIAPRWEYTANSDLWLRLTFYNINSASAGGQQGINFVRAAYVGRFSSEDEALKAGAENIKDMLFTEKGYRSNYSGSGVTFTIVDMEGELHYYRYVVEDAVSGTEPGEPAPGESDTYFQAFGAHYGEPFSDSLYDDESSTSRLLSDTYYYNGYQTVFLLDSGGNGLPAGTDIYPCFSKGSSVSIYAGQHKVNEPITSGVEQRSCESKVTLTGPVTTVQYSAAAENRVCLKNYWVSYVTQSSGGGKLYVNGATNAIDAHRDKDGNPRRVVVLDRAHAYTHEIFLANTGDAPLEVSVTLTDAVGVTLDPHWTGNGVLPAFTNSADNNDNGMPDNSTKIVLQALELADGSGFYEGPISGRLTISASSGETVTIDLSGCAGSFDFITEAMGDAVLYVPYDQAIQNTSTGHSSAVTYELTDGSLPSGLQLYPNGVVYGVPMAMGSYTFTARARLSGVLLGLPDEQVEKEFTLTVLENTDGNVWTRTDMDEDGDYRITIAIPNQDGTTGNINLGGQVTAATGSNSWSNPTMLLETRGPYARFRNLYLDGRRLSAGTDYTSEEGSTRITLRSATLADRGTGRHTLAAEFYESRGEDGTMRKASQNFTVTRAAGSSGGESGGGESGGGGNSSGSSGSGGSTSGGGSGAVRPGIGKPQPVQPAAPDSDIPFTDVLPRHWFFQDVKWAYDKKYMTGVSPTGFSPNTAVTQAMIVTVLGRMAEIDAGRFTGGSHPGIQGGTWYTGYAVWARQSGLLPAAGSFNGGNPLTRSDMAVMLVKYLRGRGVDPAPPAQPVSFADEAQMTEEGRQAFQILYASNIFKGVGGGRMDPAGSTTRAQFCVLIRRIFNLTASRA